MHTNRTKQMLLILIIFLLLLYFWPAIIAKGRHHNNAMAIFFANLLLGWTALGWIAAFVWAMTANVKSAEEIKAQAAKGTASGIGKFAILVITATLLLGIVFIVMLISYPS
jgi:Superinfection immunity protein